LPDADKRIMNSELDMMIDVGVEVAGTDAEGPGRRYALWVQGCPMRCPGCCNPELLRFGAGTPTPVSELLERILATHHRAPLDGLSLLGGEPFAQAEALAVLAEGVRAAGLSVMIYSGYTRSELESMGSSAVERLLAAADLLVDGRYEREKPDTERRWIGSTNQRLHFLTGRHKPEESTFSDGETVEIRLNGSQVIVNGWPWGKGAPW
jgi:anaerobic ribonucleoside-triphosphate reductase activating protein